MWIREFVKFIMALVHFRGVGGEVCGVEGVKYVMTSGLCVWCVACVVKLACGMLCMVFIVCGRRCAFSERFV